MTRRLRRQPRCPRLEALEGRSLMTTWGNPWPDAEHLSLSFVPDGTSVKGQQSQLFQTLNSEFGAGNWQSTILKAFQTWASQANINVGLVADGGQPIGTPGPAQGDPRFGDIRIAAEPLAPGVIALSTPYDPATGTLSGDLILNTNYAFGSGPGQYDLYTVLLHEAGHVFGFPDTNSTNTVMYQVYSGAYSGLTPADVSAIQSLYGGPRVPDQGAQVGSTFPQATPIPPPADGATEIDAAGDLATPQQADVFRVKLPDGNYDGGINVQVHTAGVSLLAAKVTVYDASYNVVGTAADSGPLDGDLTVHIAGVAPKGASYYVQVQGATGDAFSVGAYQLAINLQPGTAGKVNGASFAHATSLHAPDYYDGLTPLTVNARVTVAQQSDFYSFAVPKAGLPGPLSVRLQEEGIGIRAGTLTVYDGKKNVVATATATATDPYNQDLTVNAGLLNPGDTYYIEVDGGTTFSGGLGAYQLSVGNGLAVAAVATSPAVGAAGPQGGASLAAATELHPSGPAASPQYGTIDAFAGSAGNFFKLKAANVAGNGTSVMTVTVASLGAGGAAPSVLVYDSKGNAVPASVLANQGGTLVVQVAAAASGASYTLRVLPPPGLVRAGADFYLGVSFVGTASSLATFASGTLSTLAATPIFTLTTNEDQLFHFVLVASPSGLSGGAVEANVTDKSGHVVATIDAQAGRSASLSTYLDAGTYTISVHVVGLTGLLTTQGYALAGDDLSDPLAPYAYGSGSGHSVSSGTSSSSSTANR